MRTIVKSRSVSSVGSIVVGILGSGCSGAVSGSTDSSEEAFRSVEIDARRSLAVTEDPILERFPLERVLGQLAAQSGVPSATALSLFHQWWDTQNPGPGLGQGAHCDDQVDPSLGTVLNGYPYLCRPDPAEGSQAACDPFAADSPCAYQPLALTNRFDLAPEDGSNCGEYRIVFGKVSGVADLANRATLIFEAAMPNPRPRLGLDGCRSLVAFWASLSAIDDLGVRADLLEQLYFRGIPGIAPPVVSVAHYGDNVQGVGQIRTNSLVSTTTGWSLREFKLIRTCEQPSPAESGLPLAGAPGLDPFLPVHGPCSAIELVPVTDKTNAFGGLLAPGSTLRNAAAFVSFFPSQVATLAALDLNAISLTVPDVFDTGQSQASSATAAEMKYADQFTTSSSPLRDALEAELTRIGSDLTPDDIVLRAQANTCAGCHRLNNNADVGGGLTWPSSLAFVHVSDRVTEVVDGVTRHALSPALTDVFLPHRQSVMEDFLNDRHRPSKGPKVPIKGSFSHG